MLVHKNQILDLHTQKIRKIMEGMEMITRVTQFKTSTFMHNSSDWYFLSPMFSGSAGIIIGLIIASVANWV
jgi:hypothetical protein